VKISFFFGEANFMRMGDIWNIDEMFWDWSTALGNFPQV
jgi:hypothetical protein